jgi:myo-inositol 2-dehydrogenase/D-chiro-inositol 1-dehydrogenase
MGAEKWKYKKSGEMGPYQQEHADLIASIREGKPLNEAKRIAESTLTAIMGRMSAYTGKMVTWEQAMKSEMSLMPEKLELGPIPVAPVAMPGKDKVA